MTEEKYFGEFSGDDYRTFNDWNEEHGKALRRNSLLALMEHFDDFIVDARFFTMLDRWQQEQFLGQLNVAIDFVQRAVVKKVKEVE